MTQPSLFGDPEPEPQPAPAKPEKLPVDRPPAPIGVLRSRARACRSCGAQVVFAVTEKRKGGRDVPGVMPVDVEPAPGGNVRLTTQSSGRVIRAYVIPKAQTVGRASLHTSHFATCSEAGQHRKRGTR